MQCSLAGRQHWLLSVHVPTGLLYIPTGHCCHCDSVGDKHNSTVDSCPSSIGLEFMGISTFHRRLSIACKEGIGCLPAVASVHVHGMVSFD